MTTTIETVKKVLYGPTVDRIPLREISGEESQRDNANEFNAYFSPVSERELEVMKKQALDVDTGIQIGNSKANLARLLYAATVSISFSLMNLHAYSDMRSSKKLIEKSLGIDLGGETKGKPAWWHEDSQQKSVGLYRELEQILTSTSELEKNLSAFPANLRACQQFGDLCSKYDSIVVNNQDVWEYLGFKGADKMVLYVNYGCTKARVHKGDFQEAIRQLCFSDYYRRLTRFENIDKMDNTGVDIRQSKIRFYTRTYELPKKLADKFDFPDWKTADLVKPMLINIRSQNPKDISFVRGVVERLAQVYPHSFLGDKNNVMVYCPKEEFKTQDEEISKSYDEMSQVCGQIK